jgi:DNA repair photolyase
MMAKRFGKVSSYGEWVEPKIVSNTLEILTKEIPRLKSNIKSVQLCFTTDPFMNGFDEIKKMSLAAIMKLNEASIKCTVLTKGLLPPELATYSADNEYGITLISLDESYRERMEPGAAPYTDRLAALRALHDRGCKTWVSVEPYPTPNLIEQNLDDILQAIAFTEKIIFGRTNYSKEVSAYANHKEFFDTQAKKVITFCLKNNIQYHIKDGTMKETGE